MRSLALSLVLALSAVTLSAQDWRGQLKMVDNDLRSERYAHARKWSIKLINSMCDHLGTGLDSMYTLATTVAYRAIAEKGLGRDAEADWYWHTALAMYPKLAKNDWKPYGEVGEWLPPSVRAALAEPEHDEEHPGGDEQGTAHVEARPPTRPRRALHEERGGEYGQGGDDDVDAEGPAP